ncbi:MAG: hypothetical protein ACYC5O_21345 [Anaerolineae bacterium]
MTAQQSANPGAAWLRRLGVACTAIGRHWLLAFNLAMGIWTGLPWLAPVFMRLGWARPAGIIYSTYALFCHQLPERSWFLFGRSFTISLAEVQRLMGSSDPMLLRHFIGNGEVGWKLAWSDRMVAFYGGWLAFGLLYAALRGRMRGLDWRVAASLLLPMVLDGGSHMVSDLLSGVGHGFREGNAWLAAVTLHRLSPSFYDGNAWGSFNSLARLVTGVLAAMGLMLFVLPLLDRLTGRLPTRPPFA